MDIVSSIFAFGGDGLGLFSDLSIATIVALSTTAALFGFAIRYGKDRMVALILSLYIGLLAFLHFPYTEKFLIFSDSDNGIVLSNAIIYIVFVLIAYIIVEKIVWTEYPERGTRHLFEALILALSATALLLAFAYNVLPIASFYTLAPPIELLFASSNLFFWWLILPLISIFILGRR